MLLWMSRSARWTALRWVSVAVIPVALLTLYFTYSRGGLLALRGRRACLLALSRDRLWLLATLGDRRPRRAAGGARGPGAPQPRRQPRLPDVRRPGRHGAAHPARRDRGLSLLLFAALRWEERREGALSGRALAISRNPRVLRGIAPGRGACWRSSPRSPSAGAPGTSSPAPTSSSPATRKPTSPTLRRRPPRLLAGRDRRLRRKAAARPRRRHLPVLLGQAAHDRTAGPRRPLALPGGVRRARRCSAGCSCSPWSAACSGAAFAAWRAAPVPQRERYAALLAAMLAFAVGAGFDWFWEIAALGAVFFLAAGVVVAARCARSPPTPPRGRARAEDRRFGLTVAGVALRLDRRDRPGRAAAGRARDRRQPGRRGKGRHRHRRRPRRHRALDRALGRLALRAARPDRGAPGRIRRPRSSASARRSNARTATGSCTRCARGSSTRPAKRPPPSPTSKRRAN